MSVTSSPAPRRKRTLNTAAEILTAAEVCELLRISRATLNRLRARKINPIPYGLIGGQVRYRRAEILAYAGFTERGK